MDVEQNPGSNDQSSSLQENAAITIASSSSLSTVASAVSESTSSPPDPPPHASSPTSASVSLTRLSPSSPPPAVFGWKGFTGDLFIQTYPVLTLHKIQRVAAGGGHVLFLTTNGQVFGRGHNAHGQLGLGEELMGMAQAEPQLVTALSDHRIVAVGAGRSHSAAVNREGEVFCWGDSSDGQCGTGSLDKVLTPTKVKVVLQEGFCEHGIPRPEIPVAIDSVSCGATHTLALSVEDEIWAWGYGQQLGLEDLLHAPVPRRIESFIGRRVLMVVCGDCHSMALIQKVERTPRSFSSRHRNVDKDAVITQKHYPSLCAKCNKEIYTYTETNDTCIIDAVHECSADNNSLESSTLATDDECLSSGQNINTQKSFGGVLLVGAANGIESQNEACGAAEAVALEKATRILDSDTVFDDQVHFDRTSNLSQTTSEKNVISNKTDGADSVLKQNPIPELSNESDEVWMKRTDLKEMTLLLQERVTSLDSEGSPSKNSSSHSRTPSSGSLTSLPKTKNFVNENEARDFLARQLEDEMPEKKSEEGKEMSPSQSPIQSPPQQSSWKSFLPYSSSMMETVKTMTSKALTNIQNTVDTFVGNPGLELGDVSDTDAHSSDITVKASVKSDQTPTSHSRMTDSSSSVEFGTEASQESRLSDESRTSLSPPRLEASSQEDAADSRQSLRTIEMKQQNLDKRTSTSSTSKEGDYAGEIPSTEVILDTEVWSWGNNQKGQLGLGDSINRSKPVCIKVMSNRCVLKIVASSNHSLALTANSQVYAWGANTYSQLGQGEDGFSPTRIKFMKGCCIWDLAAGTNYSVFLADGGSMRPDIYYCGKQPGKEAHSTMQKASVPTAINELKKQGYIRGVASGGDNCYGLLYTEVLPAVNALFEFAASERAFYQELVKINSTMLKPLTKSSFFTVMDVFPFKTSLHNLVAAFISLTKKVGEGIIDLTEVIRNNEEPMAANFFRYHLQFVDEFRRYSRFFADFLAIAGFEYCTHNGSEFFEKYQFRDSPSHHPTEEKSQTSLTRFRSSMQFPFFRLKEYSRLLQKLADSFALNSETNNLLQKAVLNWDSLKLTVTADHKLADNTRLFWEGTNPRLADALRIPSRRLLRDGKAHPLQVATAGRFSSNIFILFNDMFVHLQSNGHTIFPLETVWVETPVTDSEQNHTLTIISPEDRLELYASSPAEKAEWHMVLNSAINKVLSIQKDVGRRGSTERLTPPLVRHANHKFTRHPRWKDGEYSGTWLTGKLHGQGEIKWSDGRKYTGKFKQGLQHGHGIAAIPRGGLSKEVQEGNWKDGKLNGPGCIRYANGDEYKGYFKDGQRFGHGVLQQGRHLSSYASIYVGEWTDDRRHGYGVLDDTLKGEKYMGMWIEDHRHGSGIMVTLDGMYFEGNFHVDKLTGFGLMLTDDNSCYEGEFVDITQLCGKGTLTLPTGDKLEGNFNGSWNEGLKINGTFIKCNSSIPDRKPRHTYGIQSKYYGSLSVQADLKWKDIFRHCYSILGYDGNNRNNTARAWEVVAVAVSNGKKELKELQKTSGAKAKMEVVGLEELEIIPPHGEGILTVESFNAISHYLQKAFETKFHPLGQLMENLVDVFRAAYIGVGAHPRLLFHAVQEVNSYIQRIYHVVRILFPDLPANGGPQHIYPQNYEGPMTPTSSHEMQNLLDQQLEPDTVGLIVTAAGLLYPILLPKIYPPLFDLYALYNDKEDERYWERVTKLNRQGDMALMAYLGIDQKFWLLDEILQEDKSQKLSSTKDVCYASAVDALQQIGTAFSPIDKLLVIEMTFNEITQTVQSSLGDQHMWCMDDLFPIFQFVVVRAKIRHLGAEINMVDDLMESHMEHGELGIMFTTLKASYFQIQNEKMPHH